MGEKSIIVKRSSPKFKDTIICSLCGKEASKTGAMQKYCTACSEIKDLERKRIWAKNNPLPKEIWREKRTIQTLNQIKRGKENQLKSNNLLYEKEVDSCNFNHAIIVSVPFSYGYSKNAIYSTTSHGHIYLRQQTRELRDKLYGEILEAINGGEQFYKAKIYLDILVEKPNHKGDAVNVVDTVCDAVKDAIKVDDRWFAIRSLDWRIVKENGKLIVGIYQEAECDHVVCHRCGNFYPKEEMQSRVCKYCSSAKHTKSVDKDNPGVYIHAERMAE